jgi:integrase
MNAKYRRNGRWTIRVPHPEGGTVEKAIGTKEASVARAYEAMCGVLLSRPHDRLFLIAVCENRLRIRRLFDHYVLGTLDQLRAELTDVDLTQHLADWRALLVSRYGEPARADHTVAQYTTQAARFFAHAGGPLLSHYSIEHASRWLNSVPVSPSRKRRFWAALRSFGYHLRAVGVLPRDREPLAGLEPPKAGPARERHLTDTERDALIAQCSGPVRTAEVLAHMGMELGAILAVRAGDVHLEARTIKMRGTKNRFRARTGVVEEWAVPHLRAALKGLLPNARLVPMDGDTLRDEHNLACEALGIADYRLHDARHTFAVRWWDAGVPASVIGLQLGHADGQTVERVYGKHRVATPQLHHWAAIVAKQTAGVKSDAPATKPATSEGTHGL